MFIAHQVPFHTGRRSLQQNGLSARRLLLRLPLRMQQRQRIWCAERQIWIQKWHNFTFQMSPGSACSIQMIVYVLEYRCLLPFYIGIGTLHLVCLFGKTLDIRHVDFEFGSTTIWMHIGSFLGILRAMLLPYPRCLSNAIFQHDNPRLHVQRRILTIIDTKGI